METLNELFTKKTLKFIFVGGKGGVGKTTTASSIALKLSQTRGRTLIISTDPAHNLSDAFNQQFSGEATPVAGAPNLFALEIDPKKSMEMTSAAFFSDQAFLNNEAGGQLGALGQLISAFPGIDEAAVFVNMVKMAQTMDTEVVVFDTAPTGHTLKLLALPANLQTALGMVANLKDKLSGMMNMVGAGADNKLEQLFAKVEQLMADTENLKGILTDPNQTTFVAVCIPEFLSVYETERLVQELAVQNIDIFNVVVNQIVFFDQEDNCRKCRARFAMQSKYIKQISQLYADFHVCLMPLEDEEIRGIEKLGVYAEKLTQEKKLPTL